MFTCLEHMVEDNQRLKKEIIINYNNNNLEQIELQ